MHTVRSSVLNVLISTLSRLVHLQSRHPLLIIIQHLAVACQVGVHLTTRNDGVCCVIVQAQQFSYEDLAEDLTLPGMGPGTTMRHMRPKPPQRNRRAPTAVFAPVAEEEPHSEEEEGEEGEGDEEEEGEGEGEGKFEEEEEARTGGGDAQDEGGQAGECCTSSQFLM